MDPRTKANANDIGIAPRNTRRSRESIEINAATIAVRHKADTNLLTAPFHWISSKVFEMNDYQVHCAAKKGHWELKAQFNPGEQSQF